MTSRSPTPTRWSRSTKPSPNPSGWAGSSTGACARRSRRSAIRGKVEAEDVIASGARDPRPGDGPSPGRGSLAPLAMTSSASTFPRIALRRDRRAHAPVLLPAQPLGLGDGFVDLLQRVGVGDLLVIPVLPPAPRQ